MLEVPDLSGFCQISMPGESGTIGYSLTSVLTCPWAALWETHCRALPGVGDVPGNREQAAGRGQTRNWAEKAGGDGRRLSHRNSRASKL